MSSLRPASRRSRAPRRTRRPTGVPRRTLVASLAFSAGLLLLLFFTQSLLARVGAAEQPQIAATAGSAETADAAPAAQNPGTPRASRALSACDALWAERAPAIEEGLAPAAPSQRAIQVCLEAGQDDGQAEPSLAPKIAAHWRAMRSAHYLSAFTDASEAEKTQALEEAAALADRTLNALSKALDGADLLKWKAPKLIQRLEDAGFAPGEVARLHFWTAIIWGAKGQSAGLLQIVREGVANRMHDNARIAIRLDPSIDRGGAYRLLSRLNAGLPRVPFISSWVDRDKALPQAKKALAQSPEDPGNQLILALALIDAEDKSRTEIESRLRKVIEAPARPTLLAEDWAIQKQARELLAEL